MKLILKLIEVDGGFVSFIYCMIIGSLFIDLKLLKLFMIFFIDWIEWK